MCVVEFAYYVDGNETLVTTNFFSFDHRFRKHFPGYQTERETTVFNIF